MHCWLEILYTADATHFNVIRLTLAHCLLGLPVKEHWFRGDVATADIAERRQSVVMDAFHESSLALCARPHNVPYAVELRHTAIAASRDLLLSSLEPSYPP